MPKKQYSIDLYKFIKTLGLHSFTVSDVTKKLLERHAEEFKKKKNATQYVYRHLKHLSNEGIISAIRRKNGKAIIFHLKSDRVNNPELISHTVLSTNRVNEAIVLKLKEKIGRYKTEMLISMGETEAYSEWLQEMPDLADEVKPHYQDTKEQAKLLLGRVKGFERLLADFQDRSS